ncbi:MAG: DEAD/DEAH box helicase [Acidobacteriaceae bacterium]|nr:DEAD/DEAH box helicase [Acidobacteriaceae bacterium]
MTTVGEGRNPGALVLHGKHGQGTVLLIEGDTTVVRFGHGIEQVLSADLESVVSVAEAVSSGQLAPSIDVAARVQGDVIASVNDAWGVFTRSRISLLPHQLWVCHRALRGWPIRLLIADDVGMGKTIEAGLLLWPLLANRKVQRVLVLCPAKLVGQWQIRLKRMFDIRAATYHSDLDTERTDFWGIHQIVVASLPTLRADRNGRHDRLLDAPGWDMVVIDEAHHLYADEETGKTLGFELVERLNKAGKIVSCVLFTGTPHRGKNYGFWALMSLLNSEVFSPRMNEGAMLNALPRYLIRNAKQKATDMKGQLLFKPVVQHPETFSYSPAEESFYRLLSEFILAGKAYATSLSRTEGGQVMLVLIALQKLASSSVSAVAAALRTRVRRLGAEAAKSRTELDALGTDEGSDADQALQRWLREEKRAQLRLMEDEGRYLADLLAAASQVTSETRVSRIMEVIKTRFPGEPVLLFTEYKRTQALVVSALMAEFGQGSVGFMNGDDRLEEVRLPDGRVTQMAGRREDMCDSFNAGRIRFLVSTEAGGEGIDLQERCSALIHVDLPWNPMRLHQRTGRLNRYGQQRAVQVVSLRNPDTVEGMIWLKLEQKLNSIMRALGSAMDEPEDLMQLVLGMTSESLFDELFAEAGSVAKEKLATWFDTKTGTLGGESAIKTVRDLIGHAESFDLSDLKDVPPVDLPDLMPYFQNVLALNRRRPKVEGHALSFKTPEDWLTTHALRKSYENLVFDRGAPNSADLMGVGHPLLEKALHQSARLQGTVCVVDGMPAPLMVFDVSSRVTDVSQSTRRVIVGVTGVAGEFTLLRDWEVLRLLNRCALRSEPFAGPVDADAVTRWRAAATQAVDPLLDSLDLQFGSRVVKESALIWPDRR